MRNWVDRHPVWFAILIAVLVTLPALYSALGEPHIPEPPPSKHDARMFELDREAVDEAYRQQLTHLFLVWMKDGSGQPDRAVTGARKARHAYIAVLNEIERRERH